MRNIAITYTPREETSYDPLIFGARLRQARLATGLTQVAVSRLAGVTTSHYNKLERGQYGGIRVHTLVRLCSALQMSADVLLGIEEYAQAPAMPWGIPTEEEL